MTDEQTNKWIVPMEKLPEYAIHPQGVQIKFKPIGFRVENTISVATENEIGRPQSFLVEQDGVAINVTKDCLYQLYLAACELQK